MPFATTNACSCTQRRRIADAEPHCPDECPVPGELSLFGREHRHLLGVLAQQAQMAFGEASEPETGT